MTRNNYIKMTGAVLLTLLSYTSEAQEPDTLASKTVSPATVQRLELEHLHFAHSANASGIQLDEIGYYSRVELGFSREKGSLKRVQEGANNTAYSFDTDGGGRFAALGGTYVWGRFSYRRMHLKDAEYNASLFDPLRGTPFYIADTHKSKWINQLFDMEVKAASPVLWRRLVLGATIGYQNGQAAKQLDPRPLTNLSRFEIRPGATVLLGEHHALGAYYRYSSRREDGTASNSVTMVNQPVYIMNFPGFFISSEIGGLNSDNTRIYNANCMGVGGEYTFRNDRFTLLVAGDYSREVEDVTNSFTTPKMVGTTVDDRYSVSLHASYRPSSSNLVLFDARYSHRSIDGIQYVQEYDNSFDVSKWIIKSKSIRSNSTSSGFNACLQYLRTTRGDAYNWMAGVGVQTENLDDIYYFPRSVQQVDNLTFRLFGRKNFLLGGRHSLLVGVRMAVKTNCDNVMDYHGYKADSECFKDFTLRDFHSLSSGYASVGGEVTYSLQRIFHGRGAFFLSADTDYFKASDHKDLFDDRLVANFKLGLLF